MIYNSQDMLWRRKLEEQADLQQALELQNRRLMGLQLLDVKKHHHHRALSCGSPIPSPTHSPNLFSQSLVLPQFHNGQEAPQGTPFHSNIRINPPVILCLVHMNQHLILLKGNDLQSSHCRELFKPCARYICHCSRETSSQYC